MIKLLTPTPTQLEPLPGDPIAIAFTLTLAHGKRTAGDARLHFERNLQSPNATDEALADQALESLKAHAERAVVLAAAFHQRNRNN